MIHFKIEKTDVAPNRFSQFYSGLEKYEASLQRHAQLADELKAKQRKDIPDSVNESPSVDVALKKFVANAHPSSLAPSTAVTESATTATEIRTEVAKTKSGSRKRANAQ